MLFHCHQGIFAPRSGQGAISLLYSWYMAGTSSMRHFPPHTGPDETPSAAKLRSPLYRGGTTEQGVVTVFHEDRMRLITSICHSCIGRPRERRHRGCPELSGITTGISGFRRPFVRT